MTQLDLTKIRNPGCPHLDFIDDDDLHCNNNGMAPKGYVPLGEDSEDHDLQFADIGGPYLEDITAKSQTLPDIPTYFPVVTHGSKKLFKYYEPDWVGVQLHEVLSGSQLKVAGDIYRRLGVPRTTKIVLLAYGLDALIENLWNERSRVLKELSEAGFAMATAVNYSIWDMHPHPEKIFNAKRSLIIYQELQKLGVPAVPHIYWYGKRSMELWAAWLHQNKNVKLIAIDAQTLKVADWEKFIIELPQFIKLVGRPLHFLITGPYVAHRINQLKSVLGSMTLCNSYATVKAWSNRALYITSGSISETNEYQKQHKSKILQHNVQGYERLMAI